MKKERTIWMSTRTTQDIEELIFLTGDNINESEWEGSNYNIVSICEQLVARPDVSRIS